MSSNLREPESGGTVPLGDLAGFTIGVTADRRRDEQINLLRRRGAEVRAAPALSMSSLLDDHRFTESLARFLDDPAEVVIVETAIGMRAWLAAAEAMGIGDAIEDRLRATPVLATRGPKAAAALQQVGIEPTVITPTERLADVLRLVVSEAPPGTHVAVQLHGSALRSDLAPLDDAGLRVTTIASYESRGPNDPDAVVRLVSQAVGGTLDALTFTSSAAVRNVVALADEAGLGGRLRDPGNGVLIACVGPVTAAAAEAAGLHSVVHATPGRLGLMVRALSDVLTNRRRDLVIARHAVRTQGRVVQCDGTSVTLQPRERRLLDALLDRVDRPSPSSQLMLRVWGSRATDPAALHTAMFRLRRQLRPIGLDVQLMHRRGYRLVARHDTDVVDTSSSVHVRSTMSPFESGEADRPV